MAWLSGFNNRFKLTIPADSADSSLINFPVMINLSSSSGKTEFDVTDVFDELGDDHQKRFAITKNDGTTQCQVEIEYWDATEEKAILWTKIPTVYSSVDTDIYFYYDVTTSGNTTYVGNTGDTPAQNVWDSNFKLVMHMAQDPNGDVADAIKDSTSNVNHGTPSGAMTTANLIGGKIGKAIDFDGSNDVINNSVTDIVNNFTIEVIAKTSETHQIDSESTSGTSGVSGQKYLCPPRHMGVYGGAGISMGTNGISVYEYGSSYVPALAVYEGAVGTDFVLVTIVYQDKKPTIYLDGETVRVGLTSPKSAVYLPRSVGGGSFGYFNGGSDEFRTSNTARSDAWIKATYYSNWDNFIVFQQEDLTTNWLSDWPKRIKLTIDNSKIDSTLVDFPVLIKLSDSSGISSTDVTSVFTELGSDGNRKKIAVTTLDGTTQCYVEIERFDYSNREAWLWIKVPSISSGSETIIYLYYDSDQSDNTSYVGDTGDTPAQNVWDSNFKLVTHMAQNPNGDVTDAIKDSTSNTNHGTPAGSMTTADLVDGKVGKGIEFDGSDDKITTTGDGISGNNARTIESIFKVTTGAGASSGGFVFWGDAANGEKWNFRVDNLTGTLRTECHGGSCVATTSVEDNTWHYGASVFSGTNIDEVIHRLDDAVDAKVSSGSYVVNTNTTYKITIASQYSGSWAYLPSAIGEVRISNTARSAAWLKATYYSNWDGLVSFGTDEKYPVNLYWSNRIKLTIDHTKVNSILYDFPVLIKISSESGIVSNNITDVFDKLGSNDNRRKIAITADDEVTQCSVEIERWDHVNKEAFLWVKIPEISDSVDTILYLYYDSSKDNNSIYIGDTGELPAKDVWSNDYSFVAHLSTRYNSVTSVSGVSDGGSYVTTNIARGVFLDGTNSEYLDCGATASGNSYTFETFFKTNDSGKIILRNASTSPINITVTSGTLDFSIVRTTTDKINNESMPHSCYDTLNGACCNVSDDSVTSYWQSYNSTSNWNRVDLGSGNATRICKVELEGSSGDGTGSRMVNNFKIFGSNDASNWDELYEGYAIKNCDRQYFNFGYTTDCYRYYRFNSYSNHGSSLLMMNIIHYIKSFCYTVSKIGTYTDNNPHFLTAVRRSNNDLYLFIDGQTVSGTTDDGDYSNATDPLLLGGIAGDYNTITFDEVRSSDVVRSNSWIETTYYSNTDNLITFDNPVLWYYYGYVTEEEIPVSREIRLYNRTTGELISSTDSNINTGYYYLTTTISGEHFIVVIDSDAGKDYNALILDRLLPRGIE